jgi:hypothetical protein
MANTTDNRSQNQPNQDAQVKGGQHSQHGATDVNRSQSQQSNANPPKDGRNQNQPSYDAQVKGGQQSHGSGKK